MGYRLFSLVKHDCYMGDVWRAFMNYYIVNIAWTKGRSVLVILRGADEWKIRTEYTELLGPTKAD